MFRSLVAPQTYRDTAYLLLGLVLGPLYFSVLATLYTVGLGLAVIWVGVPLLVITHALLRPVGRLERALVTGMLGERIPSPPPLDLPRMRRSGEGSWAKFWAYARDLVNDAHSWRVLLWATMRLIKGPVGFILAILYLTVPLSLLVAPLMIVIPWGNPPGQEQWEHWLWLGPVAFLLVAPALAGAVRGFATLHRMHARWALGMCDQQVGEAVVARAALAEEQVRIDQELHDSIGHMVSMIVVQAGAGAHVFDRDPDFSRRALSNIESRGRAALGELDRIIARIRGDRPESHAPLPGADDLPTLVAGARDAGVAVEARLRLGPHTPPALGRGVYRVVQEALTNAARHAPGQPVTVVVSGDDDAVAISVENPLPRGAASPEEGRIGNGVAGMRDRVALMGGRASIGPAPRGRFVVHAVLPVGAMLPADAAADCTFKANCRCLCCSMTTTVRA